MSKRVPHNLTTNPSFQKNTHRYSIFWSNLPQPVEVRLHVLRGVHGKLRSGNFTILMSMYERLGGLKMDWNGGGGLVNFGRGSASTPVRFGGRLGEKFIAFEESVYGMLPSPSSVRPCNVLVFEVYEVGRRGEWVYEVLIFRDDVHGLISLEEVR